ncbi:MAG: hypothetical protein ABSA21_00575 [Candidatus Limnocylindrales bacterium]
MIDPPVLAAIAVVIGGVAAVTARDGRIVVLGLMLAAVTSSLVASPLPDSLAVTARILGAMLASYLLWATVTSASLDSAGSEIGLVAQGAVAVAAFAIGLAIEPVDPLAGPIVAQAAGFSLVTLAMAPLAGRDVFRMGVGVALLTLGSSLLVGAWSGPTPALEQLAMAALLVGIAGATSVLVPTARAEAAPAGQANEPLTAEPQPSQPIAGEPVAAQPGPVEIPAPAVVSGAFRPLADAPAEPEPMPRPEPEGQSQSRRPMTADPIEPDAWAAWAAPEPEPRRRSAGPVRRTPASNQAEKKPATRKPGRSRPNPGDKP